MRVLVTGSGAREHALAWRLIQSPLTDRVYCAPGNGGTAGIARNIACASDDVVSLVKFCREESVTLAVLGDDASVAAGVGDALRDVGVAVFGPSRDAGRIESSKAHALELMKAAGIPTPETHVFDSATEALTFARTSARPWVVKADGLARGKGVVVAQTLDQVEDAITAAMQRDAFGSAGNRVLLQEIVTGPEVSAFALTDGERVRMLPLTCDYKRLGDGDAGPNTGGMGAYSPPGFVPPELAADVLARCMQPCVAELSRRGTPYVGVIYAGLILANGGWQVLEFNARFGDPECQVLMALLDDDLAALLLGVAMGRLDESRPWSASADVAVCLVLASAGYPDHPVIGRPLEGLLSLPAGVQAFHAGTSYSAADGLVTSGGRVLSLVARATDLSEARALVYTAAEGVHFEGRQYRFDIALREVVTSHG